MVRETAEMYRRLISMKRIVDNRVKTGKNALTDLSNRVAWRRLIITFAVFIVISVTLAYLLNRFVLGLNLPIHRIAWVAYALVFIISLVTNMSILVPVPLAVSFMIAAATEWNPLMIALAGALGGSIGELSGYYAGYLGKKLAIPEGIAAYEKLEGWVKKWGFWAILVLALQPIVPFDLGGFIAGAARMPMQRFFPALLLGKFPKYLILIYAGLGLIHFLPFLAR